MQRGELLKSMGAGAAGLVAALPTKSSAQLLTGSAPASGAALNSISTSTANYAHTLQWANAPTPNQFKPSGAILTHTGQLLLNTYHQFTRWSDYSLTHSHNFSGPGGTKVITATAPLLKKAGSYRSTQGTLVTVPGPGKGNLQHTISGVNWNADVEQTAQYAFMLTLKNNKGYYYTHEYTGDEKSLGQAASPLSASPDIVYKLEPIAGAGWTMDLAAAILFALGAPEIAVPASLVAIGFGFYGMGQASNWWGPGYAAP